MYLNKKSSFGILAWPAYATKKSNPYNFLIYDNIEKQGYKIHEFEFNIKNIIKNIFSDKYRIFHIHWPTNILTYSSRFQAKRRLITLKLFLIIIKKLNKKVVWTVHNLNGHDKDHEDLQIILNKILFTYVNGFISLNKTGVNYIYKNIKNADKQKVKYIPHPHYISYYPNNINEQEARRKLNIPQDKFVFLFFGQIRRYKNILALIKAFNDLQMESKFLLIAGNIQEDLEKEIKESIIGNSSILLRDSFVDDSQLQLYLNSSNLVVTPYSDIFNSGSVFLNMSFNKPTLAPKKGIFSELEEDIGTEYIQLYEGNISSEILKKAAEKTKNITHNIDLSAFGPENIANETITFYKSLLI